MATITEVTLTPKMIFPSTKMMAVNKLITEGSLTRLINKLIDTDTYIIPPADIDYTSSINVDQVGTLVSLPATVTNTAEVEFSMHGYYFNLGTFADVLSLFTADNTKLVAEIYIDNTIPDYPELAGEVDTEDSDEYTYTNLVKLYLLNETDDSSDIPEDENIQTEYTERYLIDLVFKHGGAFYYPINNFAKFRSVSILDIDGGVI